MGQSFHDPEPFLKNAVKQQNLPSMQTFVVRSHANIYWNTQNIICKRTYYVICQDFNKSVSLEDTLQQL